MFLLFLFPFILNATPLLEIMLPGESSLVELKSLGLDIIEEHETYVKVVGWPTDMPAIDQSGFSYRIDKENIEEFYRNRLASGTTLDELDDMGGYLTHDEAFQQVLQLAADHPNIVSGPDTIGYSLENRPIWVFKISDNPDQDEEEGEIFINACIHAREVINPMVILNFANLLTDNYGTNQRITDIVDGREIWLMPILNVDGYTYNEELAPNGGGMWRKNKRVVDDVVRGVDLNRNFPTGWGFDDLQSSPIPRSQTYRGESPASEPETQVIIDFVNAHDFNISINYHAYSNVTLIPMGYNFSDPPHLPSFYSVGSVYSAPLDWGVRNVGVNGDLIDWMADGADSLVYAILPEVGLTTDGFWPTLERQAILIEEQEEPLLAFCEHGDNPHKFQPPSTPIVETLPDTVGNNFNISWEAGIDSLNNPDVSYEIVSLTGSTNVDNAEVEATVNWDLVGFTRSEDDSHSGNYSYYSGSQVYAEHSMISRDLHQIESGDTLSFWMNINFVNGGAMVAQIDVGWITFALPGNFTVPNSNPGAPPKFAHLFGGNSQGWVLAKFPLEGFLGYDARFKIRYFAGAPGFSGGCYIDDISPTTSWVSSSIVASDITDTSFDVELSENTLAGEKTFGVLSYNAEGIGSQVFEGVSTYFDPSYSNVRTTEIPEGFAVDSVHPNPFNPSTSLNVSLPSVGDLTVSVYDILGRQVDLFNMGNCSAGQQIVNLNGSSWASGLYFIKVDFVGSKGIHHSDIQKAMLIK